MSGNEILQGNNLIAEFMNKKLYDEWVALDGKIPHMKFHSEWNSLMRVVDRIENCFDGNVQVLIRSNLWIDIDLGSQYALTRPDIELNISTKGETKIESVWLASVEFIKWYKKLNVIENN